MTTKPCGKKIKTEPRTCIHVAGHHGKCVTGFITDEIRGYMEGHAEALQEVAGQLRELTKLRKQMATFNAKERERIAKEERTRIVAWLRRWRDEERMMNLDGENDSFPQVATSDEESFLTEYAYLIEKAKHLDT